MHVYEQDWFVGAPTRAKQPAIPQTNLEQVSDINLRRHIFDAVDQALDEISPNCDSFMQFAQAIDGLQ
ncbi:MAG: hypothetical protein ORN98_06885 [Alphaproteobacteria bacterium]|nr:hypothetical protein [Alphaproteobacteria bacterium]